MRAAQTPKRQPAARPLTQRTCAAGVTKARALLYKARGGVKAVHTNPLQDILNRLDYDLLDYVETRRRGHHELLPQKARDIGQSVARLIEARFSEPEAANEAFQRWQKESLYGYEESHLVSLAVHLIQSIDRHIEMSRPLAASTSLPERPRPLARAAGAH